jgi:hypothetical protein
LIITLGKIIKKILGHPGVPGDPPEYRGFAHFQGVFLAPLGGPTFFKFFFHMVIIKFNPTEVKIFE